MPNTSRTIHIGLLGCGVVGSGTLRTLRESAEAIRQQLGAELVVRRVCVRDASKPRDVALEPGVLTTDPSAVLDDPEIDIVAELIGGLEPAGSFVRRAIAAGKHVVSANKELIAKEGHDILCSASERGLDFFFEGAVAGGIPIIRALKVSLAANQIREVAGIVNGTTNYILTCMARDGSGFAEALSAAQALGYAEADPTDDVEGHDAAYKLAILATIAFQGRFPLDQVYREGIRSIASRDIAYARELGYVIKLLAIARELPPGLELRVHPVMLPLSHPLAAVNDVFNAILVRGNAVGEVMFFGRGAGSLPTGSSVAADILEVARGILHGGSGRLSWSGFRPRAVLPIGEVETSYYVRTLTHDRPGVIAAVATIFARHDVSLESILQKHSDGADAEIVWITHRTREGRLRTALQEIESLDVVRKIGNWIRVEE